MAELRTSFETDDFTFDVEERTLTARASELGWPPDEWPYEVQVTSAHTGIRRTFGGRVEARAGDVHEELVFMTYYLPQGSDSEVKLVIYNE